MSIKDAQKRLVYIAECLRAGVVLAEEDKEFLCEALIKISYGEEPKAALGVKPKRGERVSKAYQERIRAADKRKRLAMGWLAVATTPENEGGLGLSNEEAITRIGELNSTYKSAFGLTEETLSTYLSKHSNLRKAVFELPD